MNSTFVWIVLGCLALFSCTTSQRTTQERIQLQERYKALAIEKYKDHVNYLFNESRTHVVCLRQPKPTQNLPQQRADFFVYDLSTNEIVLEDEITDGTVAWINEHQLQVLFRPGIIRDEESSNNAVGYLFDLRLGKKIDLRASDLEKTK